MDFKLRPQLPLKSCMRSSSHTLTRAQRKPINYRCLLIEPSRSASTCNTMGLWDRSPLLVAVPLWMCFGRVAALTEPEICYVLDGILFLYGIILTTLYCRIRIYNAREAKVEKGKPKQNAEEGIYTGLSPHAADTYETIGMKK